MDGGEHQGTSDDEGDATAITVIDIAEEGRHQDGAERSDAGEEASQIRVNAVFDDH